MISRVTIGVNFRAEVLRMVASVTGWEPVKAWRERHPEVGSLNHVYRKIADGTLRSIRVGNKILIAENALDLLDGE